MTTPVSPATTYTQAVELTIFDSNQFHEIVNGDAATTVTTASGDVDTVRKALTDNFYFKSPILWSNGSTNTVFNQIYTYTDGTLWFSPFATSTNPISLTVNGPYNDTNWKLFTGAKMVGSPNVKFIQATAPLAAIAGDSWFNTTDGRTYLKYNDGTSVQWVEDCPQSASEEGAFVVLRVQISRLASDAGYNLVSGSFEDGGTVATLDDVLWYQGNGRYYQWQGSFNKVVPQNSTPTTSGGVGSGFWVDVTNTNVRSGITSARPNTNKYIGMCYIDTTLGKPIWYSGTVWKDYSGTTV